MMRTATTYAVLAVLLGTACVAGGDVPKAAETTLPQSAALASALSKARANAGVRSISAIAWRDGAVVAEAAAGVADARTKTTAAPNTIYMIASCSKPVVGLALALLMREKAIDLDADINTWLQWERPPRNPAFPKVPITLRQLVTHRSSIVSDDEADYPTYARPDPSDDLGRYARSVLEDPEMWEDSAPGAREEYSNVATAVAAHVIEKAAGQPFAAYCRDRIFTPLGLKDTAWFFKEFTAEQRARVARPHDAEGQPLEHYGFDNWPSGQLRSSTRDLARLWMAVQARQGPFRAGADGKDVLAAFESTPFFIQASGGTFDHSGGEVGVSAYFAYDGRGGYAYLINHDLPDDEGEVLDDALIRILAPLSGMSSP